MTSLKLFNGDCLDILPDIDDQSVDMVLCDLPYGVTQNSWDSVIPVKPLFDHYMRICKGAVVLTARQPFTSILIASVPDLFRYEWIWSKNKASGHLNAKKRPLLSHESILVFGNKIPAYYPQKTQGHRPSNFAKHSKLSKNYGFHNQCVYEGGMTERYPLTVLNFPVVNNDDKGRIHPTQKPVALMEYLIKTYTLECDVVLDNCMGSGTTGIACLNLNRSFIGIEKDKTYFDLASDRLNNHIPAALKR